MGERLHVGARRRIPGGELERKRRIDDAGAVEVEHQHAVALPRPGGAVLLPVAGHVEVLVGR